MLSENEKILVEKKFFNMLDEDESLRFEELLRENAEFGQLVAEDAFLEAGLNNNAVRYNSELHSKAEEIFSQKLEAETFGKTLHNYRTSFLKNNWKILAGGSAFVGSIALLILLSIEFNGNKLQNEEGNVFKKQLPLLDNTDFKKNEDSDAILLKNFKIKIKDSSKNNSYDELPAQNLSDSLVKKEKKIPVFTNDTVKTKVEIKP